MKRKCLAVGIILLVIGTSSIPGFGKNNQETERDRGSIEKDEIDSPQILNQALSSRVFFTQNQGQFPDMVLFQTQVLGATVYFCHDKIVSMFARDNSIDGSEELKDDKNPKVNEERHNLQQRQILSLVTDFVNANSQVILIGEEALPQYNNYFIGNDPTKWYTNVPNYQKLTYRDLYPGIDLTYYGSTHGLKYDFIVHPGADASRIQIRYTGMDELHITLQGDLEVRTAFGVISEETPFIYQKIQDTIYEVQGGYRQQGSDVFGFEIAEYHPELPLIIDPGLNYSTFLGDIQSDLGYGIVVDSNGCAYITGETGSIDFPTTPGAYDTTCNLGGRDAFVTKLSPSGDSLVYSTFLGGTGRDIAQGIVLDTNGAVSVIGETDSTDFPTTPNAFDTTHNGDYDVFVTTLSSSGDSLLSSTYLGGYDSDEGNSIQQGANGYFYVAGTTDSSDFPTTPGVYDTTFNGGFNDCFIAKLSPSFDTLVYSTYLGGTSRDIGREIAVDAEGCVSITGWSYSSDFPTTPGAYDTSYNGGCDGFVTKLAPSANTLLYSTYFGGTGGESIYDIKLDILGNTFVTGHTFSDDFPTTPGAYDTTHNGGDLDVFVSKIGASGDTLIYSTYLGGFDMEDGYSKITIEENGSTIITGSTRSNDFPTTPGAYDTTHNGDFDVFVSTLSPLGDTLMYSTYIGGLWGDYGYDSTVDAEGYTSITGCSNSNNFPTTPGSYDTTNNGGLDVIILKVLTESSGNLQPIPEFIWTPQTPQPYQTIFFDASDSYDPNGEIIMYEWDWNSDGIFEEADSDPSTTHSWFETGDFYVTLRVTDNENTTDTKTKKVTVGAGNQPPIAEFSFAPEKPLVGQPVTFDASASYDPDGYLVSYIWDFGDQTMGIGTTTTHVYTELGHYYVRLTIMDNNNTEDAQVHHFDISPIDVTIQLQGGFGVQAIITNNEASTIDGIAWSVQVKGGVGGHINKTLEGKTSIPAGGEKTIGTGMLFGFGPITIIVNAVNEELSAEGIQFFIFSFVREKKGL